MFLSLIACSCCWGYTHVLFTFVLEDKVRSVAGDVVVGGDSDLDVVGRWRIDDAFALGASATDRQLADSAASAGRQLLPHERVQRTPWPHVAGRPGPSDVEVEQGQPDPSPVVRLDRPRTRQAATAARLRHQVGQVPDVPAAAVHRLRRRRSRDRNSARKRTTCLRLLD